MRYYIPVGPLGIAFRLGTIVTGVTGWLVYWRASRRRLGIPARSSPTCSIPLSDPWSRDALQRRLTRRSVG
jgi:hypothetical protein